MSSLATTTRTATTTPTSLKERLFKIGLQAIARTAEDFLARITKSRLSPVQMLAILILSPGLPLAAWVMVIRIM